MTWPWVFVVGWLSLDVIVLAWLLLEGRKAEYEHAERCRELDNEEAAGGIIR